MYTTLENRRIQISFWKSFLDKRLGYWVALYTILRSKNTPFLNVENAVVAKLLTISSKAVILLYEKYKDWVTVFFMAGSWMVHR